MKALHKQRARRADANRAAQSDMQAHVQNYRTQQCTVAANRAEAARRMVIDELDG